MPEMHGGRPTVEDIQPMIEESLELREYKITDKNGKKISIKEVARDLAEEFIIPGRMTRERRDHIIAMQKEKQKK